MPRPFAWLLIATCTALISCSSASTRERTAVRIASGPKDATFSILANALAASISARLPDVVAQELPTGGSAANIEAVESGLAECGLVSADRVYDAFVRGTSRTSTPHQQLRGVAVLFPNVLHVVTRADSGLAVLADLAGKRLAAARPGEFEQDRTDPRLDAIAAAVAGLTATHARPHTLSVGMDDAVVQLEEGRIDAAEFVGGFPFRPVTEAARRYGIHLLEFNDHATSVAKATYPFLKPVVVPANTYPGQEQAVQTLAVDNVLICRADLAAPLVYQLTRALYSSLPDIAAAHQSARQIDPERGASTPIPLHDGASRYYRERELFR